MRIPPTPTPRMAGQIELFALLVVVLLFSIFAAGGLSPQSLTQTIPDQTPRFIVDNPRPAQGTLQLEQLAFVTLTPIPLTPITPITPTTSPPTTARACTPDTIDTGIQCSENCPVYLITCSNRQCVNISGTRPLGPLTCDDINNAAFGRTPHQNWCATPEWAPTDGTYCIDKPVIYLYPASTTYVDVVVTIPGVITKSIPTYEANGWQDVLAHPDGRLEYKGEIYRELFYESQVSHVSAPKNGIVIAKSQLHTSLSSLLIRLGLNSVEREEFLEYWIPSLLSLKGNYILFSLIEPLEKERIDGVHISPEPDTRIEFLVYFKPLESPITIITPLLLSEKPPERKGFTMVEWGGVIDQ